MNQLSAVNKRIAIRVQRIFGISLIPIYSFFNRKTKIELICYDRNHHFHKISLLLTNNKVCVQYKDEMNVQMVVWEEV